MGSIYSDDYAPGYAPHVCTQPHGGGNGLPPPDTSGNDSTGTDSTDNHYSGGGAWGSPDDTIHNPSFPIGFMLEDLNGAAIGCIIENLRDNLDIHFTGDPEADYLISISIVAFESITHSVYAEINDIPDGSLGDGGGGGW